MTIPLEIRRRILVRAPNWVGDAIMSTPALSKLRRATPGSHIVVMCRPWVAAVYRDNPDLDELWTVEDSGLTKFWKAVKMIRQGGFDMGVAFPNSLRAAALMWFGRVGRRIGYTQGLRKFLINKPVELHPKLLKDHLVYYYTNIVEWMTDGAPDAPRQKLVGGEAEREEADRVIREEGWEDGKLRIGIAAGSIGALSKRWPAERFARVAEVIHQQLGAHIFLIGSPKEKEALKPVVAKCSAPIHDLLLDVDLPKLIAFMDRMHGFIGNDSGSAHIAAALEIPSVVIFGPTDWRATAPFSTLATVVRKPVDCSPCHERVCPIQGHPCMNGLEVNEVLKAFAELAPKIRERQAGMSEPSPSGGH